MIYRCACCGKPGGDISLVGILVGIVQMYHAGWRFAWGSAYCTDHRAECEVAREKVKE